jgi:hypothetical protein
LGILQRMLATRSGVSTGRKYCSEENFDTNLSVCLSFLYTCPSHLSTAMRSVFQYLHLFSKKNYSTIKIFFIFLYIPVENIIKSNHLTLKNRCLKNLVELNENHSTPFQKLNDLLSIWW